MRPPARSRLGGPPHRSRRGMSSENSTRWALGSPAESGCRVTSTVTPVRCPFGCARSAAYRSCLMPWSITSMGSRIRPRLSRQSQAAPRRPTPNSSLASPVPATPRDTRSPSARSKGGAPFGPRPYRCHISSWSSFTREEMAMRIRFRLGALAATTALSVGAALCLATPAHAITGKYYFTLAKTSSTPTSNPSSSLFFWHSTNPDYPPKIVGHWKAGSGQSKDPCATNVGWLPNGTYKIRQAFPNHSGTVTGPALYLSDHACSTGRLRTALFIHSSYPWSSSHYMSNGCIKLASTGTPSTAGGDIRTAYNQWVGVHPETTSSGHDVSGALIVSGP